MKERKRKHDDVHFPMGGKGKRSTPRKQIQAQGPKCSGCGVYPKGMTHLCSESEANSLAEDADREMGIDRSWKD